MKCSSTTCWVGVGGLNVLPLTPADVWLVLSLPVAPGQTRGSKTLRGSCVQEVLRSESRGVCTEHCFVLEFHKAWCIFKMF